MAQGNHVIDDLPAYTLGSLSPAERRKVEEHLKYCQECKKEFAAYADTIGLLALAATPASPSPMLKQRLMAQIAPSEKHAPRTGPVFLRWLRLSPVLSLTSIALVLALLISNVLLWNQVSNLNKMQRHGYAAVLLYGTPASAASTGMVVYTQDGARGFLVVDKLAQLPKDKQYQLWLIKGDERINGGVFSVYKDGYSVMKIEAPQLLTSYDGFGITIEPAGGSPGPTGAKVLGGSF